MKRSRSKIKDLPEILAFNLRRLLSAKGWNQAKLAEESRVEPATIQRWASNEPEKRRWPKPDKLMQACDALNCKVSDLLEMPNDKRKPGVAEAFEIVSEVLGTEIKPPKHLNKTQNPELPEQEKIIMEKVKLLDEEEKDSIIAMVDIHLNERRDLKRKLSKQEKDDDEDRPA